MFQLEIDGRTYDQDASLAMGAATGGKDSFATIETLQRNEDATWRAAFDVPPRELSKKVELRFNQAGFAGSGATRGYIDISKLVR